MGDGSRVEMTASEIRGELEDGVAAAAKRAKVPPLTADEVDHLCDIFCSNARFSAVDVGDEVILSSDGTCSLASGSTTENLLVYQNNLGADTLELATDDYSYKAVKTFATSEAYRMKMAQLQVVPPAQYGAMPDLGRYSRPDGPIANWSELLPLGKIDEARAAQEEAMELAIEDMVFVADHLWEGGADGIDFDTGGASGDADLLATLRTTEILREKYPTMGIQMGMAAEMDRLRPGRQHQHHEERGLEHRPRLHAHQAVHGEGKDPGAPQRRHGRLRRADDRHPARRRAHPGLSGDGRHPQGGRLVVGRR